MNTMSLCVSIRDPRLWNFDKRKEKKKVTIYTRLIMTSERATRAALEGGKENDED